MNSGGLRKRLLISHLGVSLGSLLLIMVIVYVVMSFSFGRYTQNQQQTEADTIAMELESSYDQSSDGWSNVSLMSVSHQAMLRSYSIRIYDSDGHLIWDTKSMGRMMQSSMGTEVDLSLQNHTKVIKRDITIDHVKKGWIEIEGLSNRFETQNRQFLVHFNALIWGAFILAIAGVTFYSIYMSKSLSRPLLRIKQIANQMKEGDLSSRVASGHHQTEIEEVGRALNHLADALEQEDRLRKNITADIAHELRTPLATIQSHIEAFQDGVWEATPDKLEICHGQVVRLVKLVQDLESLSAVENPMLKLKQEPVRLVDVIRESEKTVKAQFKEKPIDLIIQEEIPTVITGDAGRLIQVFVNLLNNAYKYTSEGSIDIRIIETADHVNVSISDTGTGIASDELPHIFERFYRGDKSRNRRTGGAGIGLAIVKAIVEAHGGSIDVESKINQGTRFTLHFPKYQNKR
ncbi:HAMP domain-containing histidine kinase [Paenibacillus timonensis]|uniref:histidine kinase n=3 Tax=Paenibacillus TaxID=44249 RepID=A0ABW3SBT9_9BACL|nr:HAMP domain-containing sensor histidine kinase [Paenibacillus timonensis]MCH1640732.1 HAMP domain-containing histidine kinase [Paenibacillus timonensis]